MKRELKGLGDIHGNVSGNEAVAATRADIEKADDADAPLKASPGTGVTKPTGNLLENVGYQDAHGIKRAKYGEVESKVTTATKAT